MTTLKQGDRINNYILENRLGLGSFGEVWKAKHHVFDDYVAIKVPTDPQYVRNLQHEGVAVHGIRHPNIVRAMDMDPYGEPPYLVMELVDGPSLREVIDRYGNSISVRSAINILTGVLTALDIAHRQGLLHRDVKPANILLAHPVESLDSIVPDAVKVTDFGLGKIGGVTANTLMQSGSLLTEEGRDIAGTIAYMAPEQKDGANIDGRADLYACGIMLFEMLTGERPQGHDLPSHLRPEAPTELDEVFRKSYARLDTRYASARDMLNALEAIGEKPPIPPPVVPPPVPGKARPVATPGGTGLRCPDCSFQVQRDDQFCIKCGNQLVESVPRCPNDECQAFVHTKDRFCVFCGTSLEILRG